MASLKNLPQLRNKLKKLRAATAVPMKTAMEKAAELVTDEQRRLVPFVTGALHDSIQWTHGTPPAYAAFKGKKGFQQGVNETRITITAGNTEVRYAHLVEFGHSGEMDVALGVENKKGARPFFYPGYRAMRKKARAIIAADVRKAVKASV